MRYGRKWLVEKLDPASDGPVLDDPDTIDVLVLLLSETLTNGIVHGRGGHVCVDLTFADSFIEIGVVSEVEENSSRPRMRSAGNDQNEGAAENGRGLGQIVRELADEWDYDEALYHDRPGVRVWFRKRVTRT
ncbi:ATP-binding protein [Actinomadura atramentaria]|uniref:ATP-binding protein n=1 Tax=Actinomadura atramentaria TaxID=1990 RepID=UPI000361A7FF|nr:ATP-binding protein [Actinomadura atramentaria]